MNHWLWYLSGVATLPIGAVVLLAALYVGDAMLYTCGWCIVLWQQYQNATRAIKFLSRAVQKIVGNDYRGRRRKHDSIPQRR